MNSVAAIVFFAAVAAANASLIAPSGLFARSYAAPALTTYSAPLSYAAPAYSAYAAPLAHGYYGRVASEDTVVAGPSGTISTSKSIGAPAYAAAYSAPLAAVTYAAPLAAAYPYGYGGLYL